ncbi:hypothetical protein AKG34_21430 [Peribacillus butanolivorans]|uniref:hypothetical protein n=1 Tax=Peribacillus butanolivorans TaxID=421767 RepID=UPI0006A73025|nr:hypothetical protein [Peribacillus butanolivorans]KON67383.1 hypothetical protein AKG34_21430 [Peribacillus butanolivorans]
MLTVDQQNERARRKELMAELLEINKGDKGFDFLTRREEHFDMLKEIEGRVAGFFKHGEFNRREFDFYLFELGDLTKADRLFGFRNLAIYDKDSGLELDDYAYAFKNLYVEYAEQWAKYIQWQIKNRVGVNEDLGHYQRVVRGGMKQLEDEIGTGDRKRILQLFPHLLYKNKVDIEQVAETWGMKRAGAVRQMKKLTDKEKGQVIIESKSGRKKVYSFNPKYTFSGAGGKKKDYDVKVYRDFLQNVITVVEEIEAKLAKELGVKELTHSALSTLHAIIPYFHYQTCYAALNPTESITIGEETVWEAKTRELKTGEESILDYLNITQLAGIVAKGETNLHKA